ncbi:unnamed protein product [Caenorhabditis auriculariae]|uniref:Rho-GAP domain-containing protein n=1 Tax=Caenorhabditis auriculariae TaxID=2777116 RepID=A0A8S1HPQ8_9PELO|nr:unnamed protein product [Caenorhabditis auriculariae]
MTFYMAPASSAANRNVYVAGRDSNVDEVMRSWEHKYCTYKEAKICISTFNVNGRSPPPILPGWFPSETGDISDIYAIGLQEMDLSVGTYIIDNTKKMEEWIDCMRKSLPGGEIAFEVIATMRLVGIFVAIFQWRGSHLKISHVSTNYMATGISVLMNKLGNKGGVAISLKINDTWVCFINSHFAAGNNELERRNQDFRDISHIRFANGMRTIYDHDVIFWFGDLNYRLSTEYMGISNEQVRIMASSNDFSSLLKYDQLREQMQRRLVFDGFVEPATFSFRPTYKYDVGTNIWDTSEKGRVPAWTDRILYWKAEDSIKIENKLMESVQSISISDHKPVRGFFRLGVKKIDEAKANQIYEEACREADRKANELLPQVKLSQTEIDFGEVKYLEPTTRQITVNNIGKSQVRFNFEITPLGKANQSISAEWLQVTPPHYVIPKGQSTQISLTVSIDSKEARKLHEKAKSSQLQDILVLHLEHGRDHFIPVTAKYSPKCFGVSIDQLLANKKTGDEVSEDDTCPKDLPREIFRLVDALRRRGVASLNLAESTDNTDFIQIRNALESGHPTDLTLLQVSSFALYSALIRLIDTLTEPVIPSGMDGIIHYEFIGVNRDARALWTAVSVLPPANRAIVEYIALMLHEFISQNAAIREQLPLWAERLFRYPPQTATLLSAPDPRVVALQTLCEYRRDAVFLF